MTVYHGSEKIIKEPSCECRNSANDFGSGFYLTEQKALAGEWACKKNHDGFINAYELDLSDLKICDLTSEEYHILNWLALLTRYRGYWQQHSIAEHAKDYLQAEFLPDMSRVDLIIGYRADDSYFSFAQDFVMGTISLQQLSAAMSLGKLGQQIVLKSPRAFSQISFQKFETAEAEIYYQQKTERDLRARRKYADLKKQDSLDDIYMLDLMRGRAKIDDLRL